MSARSDVISVVEAAYALGGSEAEWMHRLLEAFNEVLRPELGLGGYHLDFPEFGPPVVRDPVQSKNAAFDMTSRIGTMAQLFDQIRRERAGSLTRLKGRVYEHVIHTGLEEPALNFLFSERRRTGPRRVYTLGMPRVKDIFYYVNTHVDGNGFTLFAGALAEERRLSPATRQMYGMLGAHIKAGLRLRRGLGGAEVEAPREGAVLTPEGKAVHAEGEAKGGEALEALAHYVKAVDHARSRAGGRGPEALEVWEGLVTGRWSLVDRVDVDGKRYILAHKNSEQLRDPRGLTEMESRVAALAARGYPDKLIAYHLGLSRSTVAAHLAHAMTKLGVRDRAKLVRFFGVRRRPGAAHE